MQPIAAIIVTHNSAEAVPVCLRSLHGRVAEVVVVDNASSDETINYMNSFPDAALIRNVRNAGFAAAVNQGAAASSAPFLLLCNPDIELLDDLAPLVQAAGEHGAATGQLTEPDGVPQAAFHIRRFPSWLTLSFESLGVNRLLPKNPVNRRYRCLDRSPGRAGFVEQPAAAFLLVRRDAFDEVGGFDERFWPVWFEDVDFCYRLSRAGYRIWYDPCVRARHAGAHSVGRLASGERAIYWYGSLLRYAGKYFPRLGFAAVCVSVIGGALARLAAGLFGKRGERPAASEAKVIRLALRQLCSPQTRQEGSGMPGQNGGRSLSWPAR